MKISLIAGLLNLGLQRFWHDDYPALLNELGFNNKVAGYLLGCAVSEIRIWHWAPAPIALLRSGR
jgi:hypothetical protein